MAQAGIVEEAIRRRHPNIRIERLTRSSHGDRDVVADIGQSTNPGVFTTDISEALLTGEADMAVHSWKDLPIVGLEGTTVAGTLERADPRDVLLVRREAMVDRPDVVEVFTSSPRRAWQLQRDLAAFLPWPVSTLTPVPVRGNIPTRLGRLGEGRVHALVVAKAALDRLLLGAEPSVRAAVRAALDEHLWMVLPLREFPTAPAQGALAIEVASAHADVVEVATSIRHEETWRAVHAERAILAGYGGGCQEAIGATVLVRDYGTVTSVRGRAPSGEELDRWSLEATSPRPAPWSSAGSIWPRPDERSAATRRPLDVAIPADDRGWWVARADAVPAAARPDSSRIVWAAGSRTWRRLAARGFWVRGCSDGLGDAELPRIDELAGRTMAWWRLTHTRGSAPDAVATYEVDAALPEDLGSRTHFFWTSGTAFLEALDRYPGIRRGWHGCGPGRTSRIVAEALGDRSRVSIWLDYEQWHQHVNR